MEVETVRYMYRPDIRMHVYKVRWTIENDESIVNSIKYIARFFDSDYTVIHSNTYDYTCVDKPPRSFWITATIIVRNKDNDNSSATPYAMKSTNDKSFLAQCIIGNPEILWVEDNYKHEICYLVDSQGNIKYPYNRKNKEMNYNNIFDSNKIQFKNAMLRITNPNSVGGTMPSFIYPEKIIVNGPMTIAIWPDGKKTYAKCADGDSYDPVIGALVCIVKRICGRGSSNNIGKMMEIINANYGQNFTIDFDSNGKPSKED